MPVSKTATSGPTVCPGSAVHEPDCVPLESFWWLRAIVAVPSVVLVTAHDHNAVAGDGCSDICLVEPSTARCGDGVMSGAEQCDEGAAAGGSPGYGQCAADCRFAGYCGDGITNGVEQCDLGVRDNNKTYGEQLGCAFGCLFPRFCGDAVLDADEGEQCDLGPMNGTSQMGYSPCSVNCQVLLGI